jgi:hypothetical protein
MRGAFGARRRARGGRGYQGATAQRGLGGGLARRRALSKAQLAPLLLGAALLYFRAMYSVVAHNADPYLELDTPETFSNHREALEYAIQTAIVFRGAPDAPTGFTISGPDGPMEWRTELLCSHLVRYSVGLLP